MIMNKMDNMDNVNKNVQIVNQVVSKEEIKMVNASKLETIIIIMIMVYKQQLLIKIVQ